MPKIIFHARNWGSKIRAGFPHAIAVPDFPMQSPCRISPCNRRARFPHAIAVPDRVGTIPARQDPCQIALARFLPGKIRARTRTEKWTQICENLWIFSPIRKLVLPYRKLVLP